MCGRFTLAATPETLAKQFELAEVPALEARYNVAPSQPVAVVRVNLEREERVLDLLRWGLIPPWAKDPGIGAKMINARSETVAEKPSFRAAFKKRRCLIVADGFYEWQKVDGQKQPYYFRLRNGEPFAFAGLWERWQDPSGPAVESCTILTAPANQLVSPVHERMPVILRPQDYALWLDPGVEEPARLQALLRPFAATQMKAHPVSARVNRPANDGPELIAPMAA